MILNIRTSRHAAHKKSRELGQLKEGSPEWRAAKWELNQRYEENKANKHAARQTFAALNNWKITHRYFEPQHIGKHHHTSYSYNRGLGVNGPKGRCFNHQHGYRKDNRYFAIVSEPYEPAVEGNLGPFKLWLNQHWLDLFMPPDPLASTWFPGATLFLVIAAQGEEIKWLPEQDGRLAHLWKRASTTTPQARQLQAQTAVI